MSTLTRTRDLVEERSRLTDAVDELEGRIEELTAEADVHYPPQDAEDRAEIDDIETRVDGLNETLVSARGLRNAVDAAIEEWDGTEVVFRELSGSETRLVAAQAQERAVEAGLDYPEGYHEKLFLQNAVDSTPPGAPDPGNIGDLGQRLFELFLSRANTLNTVGDFEMGNSSLRDRLTEMNEATAVLPEDSTPQNA